MQFRYLDRLEFETEKDRVDILKRGKQLHQQGKVPILSIEMGQRWKNQIASDFIPSISLRWLGNAVGVGAFAEDYMSLGSYVGEYVGIIRRNDRRYFEPRNDYCYEYPVPDEIGRSFVIDATQGNWTRFINHSFSPNLQPVAVFIEGVYHQIFLTVREILPGTQLTYDYGRSYWYARGTYQEL